MVLSKRSHDQYDRDFPETNWDTLKLKNRQISSPARNVLGATQQLGEPALDHGYSVCSLSRANLFVKRSENQRKDFCPPVSKARSNKVFEAFFDLAGEKRDKIRAGANFQACLLSDSSTWSTLQMSKELDLACCGLQPLASMPSFAPPMV